MIYKQLVRIGVNARRGIPWIIVLFIIRGHNDSRLQFSIIYFTVNNVETTLVFPKTIKSYFHEFRTQTCEKNQNLRNLHIIHFCGGISLI